MNYNEIKTGLKAIYYKFPSEGQTLKLVGIESISDEDAIKVAQLAHQIDSPFFVKRRDEKPFLIHLERTTESVTYHISINQECCVNANWHFPEMGDMKKETSKINIGEIQSTSKKPVPYIAIVDFLRSKGYALPFGGLSVDGLIRNGLISLNHD